jgi:hypothetical protein
VLHPTHLLKKLSKNCGQEIDLIPILNQGQKAIAPLHFRAGIEYKTSAIGFSCA